MKFLRFFSLIILACAGAAAWYGVFSVSGTPSLTVAFLDVGQGDAIFIESPSGVQVLIDGGPDRSVLRALGGVMPFTDRSIDMVMATHPDQDHIGGLSAVLDSYTVSKIIKTHSIADTAAYRAFDERVSREGADVVNARRGRAFDVGGGAVLTILFPDRDLESVETNTGSVSAVLRYGDTAFLFTGDAPQAIEEYLARLDGNGLDVDVLKAGHHGSRTSTAAVFVGYASPAYAVISAGRDNRYGHPHPEVLETLERFGVETVSTAESGTVIFKSDGKRVLLK